MRDLKCALKICTYNKGYCCCAKDISVDSAAFCRSYTIDEDKTNDVLFEIGLDETKPNYSVDTKVACTAPCIFQKGERCVAVGITVLAKDKLAECASFVLR